MVLEQSNKLRVEGTSITLWNNAMQILDLLDIADQFKSTFLNMSGPHEMRSVERKILLEALATQIPEGSIRFNSRVIGIKKSKTSPYFTNLELQDGSTYSAKVVDGFDGVNSIVGSWLGLEKPTTVGQLEIRGMAEFHNGHNFGKLFRIFLGRTIRFAIMPMTSTKAYWFLVWTDWSEGWRNVTPDEIKQEALEFTKDFRVLDIQLCINNTSLEHFTKNTLRHRLNTIPTCETQVVGNITVCGDASHPTTPNLGQGGGMALEDGIILARKLHQALKSKESQTSDVPEPERIHEALLDFHRERYPRTNALTQKACMIGASVMKNTSIECFLRDWFFIPKSLHTGNYMDHALFDVGKLSINEA